MDIFYLYQLYYFKFHGFLLIFIAKDEEENTDREWKKIFLNSHR